MKTTSLILESLVASAPATPGTSRHKASYKLILAYDGTHYFGWQATKSGPSIQETLQQAIFQISRQKVLPEAASRTDRGVHAQGQVVQISLEKEIPPDLLMYRLNAVLPRDIRVKNCSLLHFHPTLDAKEKEYRYKYNFGPVQDPTEELYVWHLHHPVEQPAMEKAAPALLGTHDFSAFTTEERENPICTIHSIAFEPGMIAIRGNRFLYKMVRILIGTLIYIGQGKIPPHSIPSLLLGKDRKKTGITAPPRGLYLHQVIY